MSSLLAIVAVAAALLGRQESQEPPKVDRERLEWFKKLTPEEKKALREKLEQFKKLPPEERERLKENLKRWRELPEETRRQIQERVKKLSPEERRELAGLAQEFARTLGEANAKAFPRLAFFAWMRRERPEEVERIRKLDPEKRREAIRELIEAFKNATLRRVEEHLRRHGCLPAERIESIRKADPSDFWPQMKALQEELRAKHPVRRGPPRRRGPPGPPPQK